MKNILYVAIIALAFMSCEKEDTKAYSKIEQVSLSTGSDYTKDIYYSLTDGIVKESDRTSWDLAFTTGPMTSSIYINDGNGVKLYLWGNIEAYDAVDTTGIKTKEALYNHYDAETWGSGAFDQTATGHPDYGWGKYNDVSHNVDGQNTYVVLFNDGSAKKLIVEKREATNNTFYLKYANIDGTEEQTPTVDCGNHVDKNMIHFSMQNNTIVEHEPTSANWDVMFTKYITMINMGVMVPYPVTGVLSNNSIESSKNAETDTASHDYMTAKYEMAINTIGSDWKSFNMETYAYDIEAELLYYVKDANEKYYKLVFTDFEGSTTGKVSFVQTTYN